MSAIFEPYRALGVVCSDTRPVLQSLGTANFLTVPIGNSFLVYNCEKLTPALISPPSDYEISCIATFKEISVAASDNRLIVWKRLQKVADIVQNGHGAIQSLIFVSSYLMILFDDGWLEVVDVQVLVNSALRNSSLQCISQIPETALVSEVAIPVVGTPTGLIHPSTYLNKVVVTTDAGIWYVVNFRTAQVLYESKSLINDEQNDTLLGMKRRADGSCIVSTNKAQVGITCVVQSPAVDVLAFGLTDGRIVIQNIRLDKTVVSFRHSAADAKSSGGAVTSLSFCTNTMRLGDLPLLLSATDEGAAALWDLKERKLHVSQRTAHKAAIVGAFFLPQQSCYITAGADNAIKMWILDSIDAQPRLLRSREGHSAPPRCLKYYAGSTVATLSEGADAFVCEILSAGDDSTLRMFHTAIDRQSREISQGSLIKKARQLNKEVESLRLNKIIDIACSERRYGQFHDIVTAHANDNQAYVWNYEKKALGTFVLPLPEQQKDGSIIAGRGGDAGERVTSVCLSACGNYAILGGSNGMIARFSMQSGAPRGEYPKARARDVRALRGRRHKGPTSNQLPRPDKDTGKSKHGIRPSGQDTMRIHIADSIDRSLRALLGEEFVLPSQMPYDPHGDALKSSTSSKITSDSKSTNSVTENPTERTNIAHSDTDLLKSSWAVASGQFGMDSIHYSHSEDVDISFEEALSSTARWRHVGAIRGLAISRMNSELYSAGADGTIRWWNFQTHELSHVLYTGTAISRMSLHSDNGLLAIACDDGSIRIIDSVTRRQVRKFLGGHKSLISDLCFNADGRWLISSAYDGTIRVWDIPTARCIDWMKFKNPVTAIAFSPTNEYLVTSHSDDVGLYMWTNRAHFTDLLLDKIPRKPRMMDIPQSHIVQDTQLSQLLASKTNEINTLSRIADTAASENDTDSDVDLTRTNSTIQWAQYFTQPHDTSVSNITFSGKPASQWQNLARLDEIAKRNKPVEPPKEPEKAPFFLPTTSGVVPTFEPPKTTKEPEKTDSLQKTKSKMRSEKDNDNWVSEFGEFAEEGDLYGDDVVDKYADPDSHVVQTTGPRSSRSRLAVLLHQLTDDDLNQICRLSTSNKRSSHDSLLSSRLHNSGVDADMSDSEDELEQPQKDSNQFTKSTLTNSNTIHTLKAIASYLAQLPPSKVDVEMRSLCLGNEDTDGIESLRRCLAYFLWKLYELSDFELVQAQLQLVLKLYGLVMANSSSCTDLLHQVKFAQKDAADQLQSMFHHSLCLIKYISHIQ